MVAPARDIATSKNRTARIFFFKKAILSESEIGSATSTGDAKSSEKSTPRPGRFQHAAYNLRCQGLRLSLQCRLRCLAIFLDVSLRRLHLPLSFAAGFVHRRGTHIESRLAPRLLGTEYGRPRLAQTLLVLGGTRLSRGN